MHLGRRPIDNFQSCCSRDKPALEHQKPNRLYYVHLLGKIDSWLVQNCIYQHDNQSKYSMLISYFPEQVSLAGRRIIEKFVSVVAQTDNVTTNSRDADAAIIWSVLWNGRMKPNQAIYEHYRQRAKPVIILETGNIIRGQTYKVCVNNINKQGTHAIPTEPLTHRAARFGSVISRIPMGNDIIVCGQQQFSLLWQGQPRPEQWAENIITNIRNHTQRPIVIRPHPRQQLVDFRTVSRKFKNVSVKDPIKNYREDSSDFVKILNTARCIVGHNSGCLIEAGLRSIPVICHGSSLSTDISISYERIESDTAVDTSAWTSFIQHTEWFEDEIASGVPWQILRPKILRGEY